MVTQRATSTPPCLQEDKYRSVVRISVIYTVLGFNLTYLDVIGTRTGGCKHFYAQVYAHIGPERPTHGQIRDQKVATIFRYENY